MTRQGLVMLTLVAMAASFCSGCIAASVGLATKVVGGAVNDADVKKQSNILLGKDAKVADEHLGAREETLVDRRKPTREVIIYPVKGDSFKKYRYAVEVVDGEITTVTKKAVGEDKSTASSLWKKLEGKSPSECERIGKLEAPVTVLRSVEKGDLLNVYDSSKFMKGTMYLVLRFKNGQTCTDLDIIGIRASSGDGDAYKSK